MKIKHTRWKKYNEDEISSDETICSVKSQKFSERYHFALVAIRKIESRSMSSCYIGISLHSGEPCCFSMGSWNPSEERESTLSGRLLVSDIHNTRHPPRHPMLSPREILFSFPEVQSASPTSFVVVHRLHLVSPDSRLLSLSF